MAEHDSTSQRDYDRLWEAIRNAATERSEIRASIAEMARTVAELRERRVEARGILAAMAERVEDLEGIDARVSIIETRLGDIANRMQAQESFLNITKAWSMKVIVVVLLGLAAGSTVLTKVIEFLFDGVVKK